MNPLEADVDVFMREVANQFIPDQPSLDTYPYELRVSMIMEEAREFLKACGVIEYQTPDGKFVYAKERPHDWAQMVDACIDLLYVTVGALRAMGLGIEPFWSAVHRANMAKKDGPLNALGKRLKPPGWLPPDIMGLLAKLRRGTWGKKNGEE